MRTEVDVHDAVERLSELQSRAEAGEDVMITRNGSPVVCLVPVAPPRPVGFVRGSVSGDFAEPLPEDELNHWGR